MVREVGSSLSFTSPGDLPSSPRLKPVASLSAEHRSLSCCMAVFLHSGRPASPSLSSPCAPSYAAAPSELSLMCYSVPIARFFIAALVAWNCPRFVSSCLCPPIQHSPRRPSANMPSTSLPCQCPWQCQAHGRCPRNTEPKCRQTKVGTVKVIKLIFASNLGLLKHIRRGEYLMNLSPVTSSLLFDISFVRGMSYWRFNAWGLW